MPGSTMKVSYLHVITVICLAGCDQEQAPVAEPMIEEPAAAAATSDLLPHQELARELLRELIMWQTF